MEQQFNLDKLELLNAELGLYRIKQFFSPQLLRFLEKHIVHESFNLKEYATHDGKPLFSELVLNNEYINLIHNMMQDQVLIKGLGEKTNLPKIYKCVPRIYKFLPGSGNKFGWHQDLAEGRTLGFSVNLTKEKFEGGEFMIRRKDDPSIHVEYQNNTYGDAIFFPIAPNLEHCVAPVTGSVERIAYAGWFIS